MIRLTQEIEELRGAFYLSTGETARLADSFSQAVGAGLAGKETPLHMLKAHVARPSGLEKGRYLALDFGGSNVRAACVLLTPGGGIAIEREVAASLRDPAVGRDLTSASTSAEALFDFLAQQIAKITEANETALLGHTYSFAATQESLGKALFAGWTKEIQVAVNTGQDINQLLTEALNRQSRSRIIPCAVVHDTVATLLTAAYGDSDADIGSICGTGHNSCFVEAAAGTSLESIFNTEAGNFDRQASNSYDILLDRASEAPGQQRLEKMASGRYLGELLRLVVVDHMEKDALLPGKSLERFRRRDFVTTSDLAVFLADDSAGLNDIEYWLAEKAAISGAGFEDLIFIQKTASFIVDRAAGLIAATFVGMIKHMDSGGARRHIVGIDGTLYAKLPGFAEKINRMMDELSSLGGIATELRHVRQGSIIGAAVAAAIAEVER